MGLLDFIFPRRCVSCQRFGSYICAKCFSYISFIDSGTCIVCQKAAIGSLTHPKCLNKYTPDGAFSSLVYRGVVKRLIYRFKYKPFLSDMSDMLLDLFYEGIIQKEEFMITLDKKSVFVPIPLHQSRMRERGYNHSEILAKGLSQKFNIKVLKILHRTKNTKRQFGLKKEEREENIRGAFGIKNNELGIMNYGTVFLVDDVLTSGATIKEAAKVLKKAGVKKVYGLTLAHGE